MQLFGSPPSGVFLRTPASPRPGRPRRSTLEAATSGVASGPSPGTRTQRPGPRAAFPLPEGRAGKRVLPIRDWNSDSPATSGLRGLSCGSPGPRPGPVASRQPPSRPGPRLRDGFVLAGGGGAEGGSGRESEVGPAAFLGIRCRHSLPPLLRRGRG